MSILDPSNPLSPNYRVVIETPEQARIYRKFLIAKIVVQLVLIAGLMALGGVSWYTFVAVVVGATIWQGISMYRAGKLPSLKFLSRGSERPEIEVEPDQDQ